jgi:hypothetical protein
MSESSAEAAIQPSDGGDAQAQQQLADAVAAGQFLNKTQPPAPSASASAGQQAAAGEPEPTDWEAEASKWKSLARKHEKGQLSALGFKSMDEIEQLRQAARKHVEFEDAQKSELQKQTERAQTYEQQLADLRSTNARLLAAATHNIPPELIDLLGAGTDEEIAARAELLAERLKAAAPAPAPAVQRPVEALTPGAAPASSSAAGTPDQWIRRMSGRTP